MSVTEADVHAFLEELTREEGRLRQDNASGDYDEDAMWDRERAYMRRYYRKWYRPWVVLGDNPGSDSAKKHAANHRPFTIYKMTPYEHPEYPVWLAVTSRSYDTAPPYNYRFAVAQVADGLKVVGHQQACGDCFPDGGCAKCAAGWVTWNEGNDKTKWLDTLGGPSGPAVRYVDPGPRYAALHERED